MKNWILFFSFLFIISCHEEKPCTYFTQEKASQSFHDIENICDRDNGALWGKHLYGPIMFVDRISRKIVANFPDKEGLLKEKDDVYTGLYPKENMINNGTVIFGGSKFAMVPMPKEEDDYRINSQAIHSLFHSFQESSEIIPACYNTSNMDEKEARLWIKLEWKALRKALKSKGGECHLAIRDALIFRGANRELYHKYADDENQFENHEGLATFTYTMLTSESREEYDTRLFKFLDRNYAMQSYSRSYGFIHGALYATLLYDKGFDFTKITTNNFDLGNAVKELYDIVLPEICRDVAGSLAVNYNVDAINKEEALRLTEIKERVHKQISTFTEKPVVFLELESPYFDFEPEDIHSLDTLGTLYPSIRVSDNWGKLTVNKGGCLVSHNFKSLRINAKGFKKDKNHVEGEGWVLILNKNWELIIVNQNYFISKLMP
jgi:hypothetical protein